MSGSVCDRRADFPEITEGFIYFDNAASTLKPRQIVERMADFMLHKYANVHRGLYRIAAEATKLYDEAHDVVGRLLCAGPRELAFTPGTTGGLHLAAHLAEHNGLVKKGDIIVAPGDAHNSNLLPWRQVARRVGAELKIIPVDSEGRPRWELLDDILATGRVSIVAVTHVSNVTGYESPVKDIAQRAKKAGALVVVDSAQGVPHVKTCVKDLGADMLAFSGHKMLGPTGIGGLWMRRDLAEQLEPPLGGGGTIKVVHLREGSVEVDWEEPPYKFESGTPPIAEAIGFAAAAEYLMGIGMEAIEEHERMLVKTLLEGMGDVEGIEIVGPRDWRERRGIVVFNVKGHHPDSIGVALGARGIALRTGRHCADILYDQLGYRFGGVRASFYFYNCTWEVERLVEELKGIVGH
ncbi:MAG: cysteine desulfurase [Desulfurococcales archaeon]|nr:cysteine desulfurase [Desulfurococcales archaeon]